MKKIILNYILATTALIIVVSGCKRDSDYLKMSPSPYISNFDLRKLYTGEDIVLNTELTRGATLIRGQVISDHSANNLPAGLLILQNSRMVGNGIDSLRGMAIQIGADAAQYVTGDLVHIRLEGGVLTRKDGILQITGLRGSDVTKVESGTVIPPTRGVASQIQTSPDWFDCTMLTLTKATYNPELDPGTPISGMNTLNDGTDNLLSYVDPVTSLASHIPPYQGNYTGIVFDIHDGDNPSVPHLRIRTVDDIEIKSSEAIEPPDVIITGFCNDPEGTDANYEYVQLRATRDINFVTTPFTLVTSNNAGASTPTGAPQEGWATGGLRSYKLEISSGSVNKGDFFYVGGSGRRINAANSTQIPTAKWPTAINYRDNLSPAFYPGGPQGATTTNLLANSGNACGIAVFRGLEVRESSVPIDVVWVATGGEIYGPNTNPPRGYRIGDTDHYDIIEPLLGTSQPFYRSGTNVTRAAAYGTANLGLFLMMGGAFDTTLKKWVKARRTHVDQIWVDLSKESTLEEIENELSTEIR